MPPVLLLTGAVFLAQGGGFHIFTASLPLTLSERGIGDIGVGVLVGTATLAQIPAALTIGALADRWGSRHVLLAGSAAYVAGALLLALSSSVWATWVLLVGTARVLQGIGLGAVLPAAYALATQLPKERHGVRLGVVGSVHSLSIAFFAPFSIFLLAATSFAAVGLLAALLVSLGILMAAQIPQRPEGPPRPYFHLAYRRDWSMPLGVLVLFALYWGVVTAYLPQRAQLAGADVGVFFAADGLGVIITRIPAGWLADRVPGKHIVLAAASVTGFALLMLLPEPDTLMLALAGLGVGVGAGLLVTLVIVVLARRSSQWERGSVFAFFSAALAASHALGSIGLGQVVAIAGFEAGAVLAVVGVALAALVALLGKV